jgi:hypothetical protein
MTTASGQFLNKFTTLQESFVSLFACLHHFLHSPLFKNPILLKTADMVLSISIYLSTNIGCSERSEHSAQIPQIMLHDEFQIPTQHHCLQTTHIFPEQANQPWPSHNHNTLLSTQKRQRTFWYSAGFRTPNAMWDLKSVCLSELSPTTCSPASQVS